MNKVVGAAALALLAALAIAGTTSCSRMKAYFTDGRTAVQKAFEAKQKATSFRSRTEVAGPSGRKLVTESAVSCPGKQHLKTVMGDTSYQNIRAGAAGYVQVAPDQPWQKMPIPPDAVPCGSSSGVPAPWAVMSEGTDVLTTLVMMSQGATFERGQYVHTEAGACQQWLMGFSHPGSEGKKSGSMKTVICIGDNGLPVQVTLGKTGGIKVTYSDWNQPIAIEAPANAVELKMEAEGANPHGAMSNPHGMANPHSGADPHAGIKIK